MKIGHFEFNEPIPDIKESHVLAVLRPWIDVGSVGTLSLSRLERHLRAKEIGRLESPGRFYDFTRYRPRSLMNEGKREFNVPNTIIRHAQMSEGPDLLLVHLLEPHLYGEEYVETMLEVFEYLGVKKYSLIGAMYDMVPHTRPLIVSGVGVGSSVDEENLYMNVKTSNYEGPTSITYLIGQGAAKKGLDTRIYVVHLPQYFQVEEDLSGTARLVEILCRLYNLPDRLIESDRGKDQYQSLQKMFEEESEVSSLLQRLEEKYDQDNQESEISLGPLSQDIEEFLKGFDEDLSS
tara:strand:- start:321 stop:1196 length:876 start_codon:yes stop_codon:yes gene_type:complete